MSVDNQRGETVWFIYWWCLLSSVQPKRPLPRQGSDDPSSFLSAPFPCLYTGGSLFSWCSHPLIWMVPHVVSNHNIIFLLLLSGNFAALLSRHVNTFLMLLGSPCGRAVWRRRLRTAALHHKQLKRPCCLMDWRYFCLVWLKWLSFTLFRQPCTHGLTASAP